MEEKTARMLIVGAIIIVLAGGIFGGWFKAAADMIGRTPAKAATGCTANGASYGEGFELSGMKCTNGEWVTIATTTTRGQPTTTKLETTTTLEKNEPPQNPTPVNGTLKLERQSFLEYKGYKLKLDGFVYEAEGNVYGILIDVVKPDGTEVQAQADKNADAIVDSLEIKFDGKYPEDKSWATVKIWEPEPVNGSLKLETQKYTEYKGYKFQLDHAILAAGYKVAGILIDVVKPDGTEVKVQVDNRADGVVDSLQIHFDGKYQQDADGKYIEEGWVTVKVWENKEN